MEFTSPQERTKLLLFLYVTGPRRWWRRTTTRRRSSRKGGRGGGRKERRQHMETGTLSKSRTKLKILYINKKLKYGGWRQEKRRDRMSSTLQWTVHYNWGGIHSQEMIKMKWLRFRSPGFLVTFFLYSWTIWYSGGSLRQGCLNQSVILFQTTCCSEILVFVEQDLVLNKLSIHKYNLYHISYWNEEFYSYWWMNIIR